MTKGMTILAFAAGLSACSYLQHASTPARTEHRVIVRLVGRDSTLTARATGHGPAYSLHTNAGQTLVAGKTLPELTAEHPDLARRVRMMQATPWAGVD